MHSTYLAEEHPTEWSLNCTTSQSLRPTSVISDNTPGRIFSEEHDSAYSALRDADVATGGIEEAQAEAPTKTEIVPLVRHDISTRALTIIFIAIGIQVIFLLFFKDYL